MDQFHERENEEREIVAQSLEQQEQAQDIQPEEMVDNMIVEFRRKRATAFEVLMHTARFECAFTWHIHFDALLSWFLRVCYFHTTGRRLLDVQSVEECYGNFLVSEDYGGIPYRHMTVSPFVACFQDGMIEAQEVSVEPMISLETYEKFLTAVSEGRASFTTRTNLEVHIGQEGDREKIATIGLGTSMALQMAE
jgi:hypothetical protein